jgi:hypothetical protein
MFSTTIVFGNYNPGAASTYAQNNYDTTESGDYYYFSGKDCTNFVSQCVKKGGITVKENTYMTSQTILPTLSYILDDDTTYRYWYMKKKKTWGKNYYLTTANWTSVEEFRTYQNHHEGTAYQYKNDDAGRSKLLNDVKVGDVIQAGDKHSVIVSQIDSRTKNGVKYCAHSDSRLNREIKYLFDFANENNCQYLYLIKFK